MFEGIAQLIRQTSVAEWPSSECLAIIRRHQIVHRRICIRVATPEERLDMLNWLSEVAARPWMGVYLRVLAVVLGYGAIVHIANMAGFGEKPWMEGPLSWRVGDVVYGVLNIVAAVALWMRSPWGIVLFCLAVGSQFIIYTAFINHFAFTPEHRHTIYGLLGTEALLIAGFVGILLLKR